ncbi:hypothetical protein [Candidatus Vidania fulgoroideorum]
MLFIIGSNCFYAYITSYSVNPSNGNITNISILSLSNKKYRYVVPVRYSKIGMSLIFRRLKKTIYIIRKYIPLYLNNTNNIPIYIYLNLANINYKLPVLPLVRVFSKYIYTNSIQFLGNFYTF